MPAIWGTVANRTNISRFCQWRIDDMQKKNKESLILQKGILKLSMEYSSLETNDEKINGGKTKHNPNSKAK